MYAGKTRDRLLELVRRYVEDGSDALRRGPVVKACHSVEELLQARTLFFVTTGRTGTKSVIDVLQRHSSMYAVHAPVPAVASIGYRHFRGQLSAEAAGWAYYASRERYLMSACERDMIFCDGDCKVLPMVEQLAELMPNARFLHIYRRPEGFIRSGLTRGYFEQKSPELWGHLHAGELPASVTREEQARLIARFWEIANQTAMRLSGKVGAGRFASVASEDMFSDVGILISALESLDLSCWHDGSLPAALPRLNENRQGAVVDISDEALKHIVGEECPSLGDLYAVRA